jgi:hypothetical protein
VTKVRKIKYYLAYLQAFFHTRTTEGFRRCTVRLIKAGFEHKRHPKSAMERGKQVEFGPRVNRSMMIGCLLSCDGLDVFGHLHHMIL